MIFEKLKKQLGEQILDLDTLIIFAVLATTVKQTGDYINYAANHTILGYAQSIAIDFGIFRTSYFIRFLKGKNQLIAIGSMFILVACSIMLNISYLDMIAVLKSDTEKVVLAVMLPIIIFVLSFFSSTKMKAETDERTVQKLEEKVETTNTIIEPEIPTQVTPTAIQAEAAKPYPLKGMDARKIIA